MNYDKYHETRFGFDARRRVLWQTLTHYYFQRYVPAGGAVLELGAGYCDFIDSIAAGEKWALDIWPGFIEHADADVKTVVGDLGSVGTMPDSHFDLVFASNLFEHVTREALAQCLAHVRRKLKPNGLLIAVQPNYKYCVADYFDDYTHVAIWSHVSLADFFNAHGFAVEKSEPRFLPLTIKSRLPVSPLLIRAYLASPIKLMGKQMMIAARLAEPEAR